MKKIIKTAVLFVFLVFWGDVFGQEYLGGKKTDIASFFKLKKIQYEEEKIDKDYSRFSINSHYDDGSLKNVSLLTFKNQGGQTVCIKEAMVFGYSTHFYRETFQFRYDQGFKATNYLDSDGFLVMQHNFGPENKRVLYCVVSSYDQDNDGKDDIVVETFYLDTSEFKTK